MTRSPTLAMLVIVVVIVACAVAAFGQTGRHGDGHAQHHDWYRSLTKPNSALSCCNAMTPDGDGDCRPVRAVQRDDGWFAYFEGEGWVEVPRHVILPDDLNREPLDAHACRSKAKVWHCFLRKGGGT